MSAQASNVLQHPAASSVQQNQVQQVRDSAPQFATSLEENARRMQELRDFVRNHMKEGVDFGTIPSKPKSTLFRPGAEKLLSAYGFAAYNETLHRIEDFDKGFLAYEIKVVIKNKRSGLIEAEGIGSCNSKERKYKNQDAAELANTILRMAKKRALIDATLLATRSSELFQTGDHSEASDESAPVQTNNQSSPRRDNDPRRNQPQRHDKGPRPEEEAPKPEPILLASRELVANTERLRRLAVAEGYFTNSGAHLTAISHNLTQGQCTTRFEQLKRWLKANAPESLKDLSGSGKFKPTRDAQYSKCRSCGWPITFVASGSGGNMPVDADGVPHFMMCTKPAEHRKAPERKPTPRPTQAPGAPAKPAVPSHAAGLPKHVKHLWAVVNNAALPPALKGRARQERIDTCNQVLLDHEIDAIESFNDLDEAGVSVLCAAIDTRLIVASPEGNWEVAS